jgi:murein DD-endopeptidase MepM/ murein hydrolase activator NlpD
MKKYILIIAIVAVVAGGAFSLYHFLWSGGMEDPVKLEDAIIIHGIQMDSDTPQGDGEDEIDEESGGNIIYNDAFDDTIIDYDKTKNGKKSADLAKEERKDYEQLRIKDKRWHICSYRIKKNDNLWKIAKRFGVHPHLIISLNEINNPGMLKPGRSIQVPTRKGVFYRVDKGDSISRIAARYKISGKSIIAHNRLKKGLIRPGQKIFLPDAREPVEKHEIALKKKKGAEHSIAALKGFIWPLRGRITSGFGNRRDPLYGQKQFHCGIDISANVGTNVHAAADGRVIFSGWKTGYGNVVIVRHDGGYITVYAHNSKNSVSEEDMVKRGDLVAYSGMTGAVTGAHLHFEIRKYVNPLNPLRLLAR